MESVRLSEIYCKLEEIEADKAPARCVCVCVCASEAFRSDS